MSDLGKFDYTNSLRSDGSRNKIYPADVKGIYQSLKKIIHPIMMAIFVIVPLLHINGQRVLLLDIGNRNFFIFGLSFNAQDIYLLFFLVTGLAFALFFITAVVGRIFCGWACPQTVFLEGLYRKIERLIEGPHTQFFKNTKQPWNGKRVFKIGFKYFAYILLSMLIAGFLILYFVPMETYHEMWGQGVSTHPIIFGWFLFLVFALTFNFGWFREQVCLILCPYGRIQSALTDDDTLVIGYDPNRGEPRGKVSLPTRGACIDCNRCVVVCPTGIDIRNGLQMECIGCANCIDACNEVMDKVGQARGLIRYDSYNGLFGKPKQILRPRVYAYTALMLIGMLVSGWMFSKRSSFEANMIRFTGPTYVFVDGKIRNQFEIHLFNKERGQRTFSIEPVEMQNLNFILPIRQISLESMKDRRIPVFVEMDQKSFEKSFPIQIRVLQGGKQVVAKTNFLGPRQ